MKRTDDLPGFVMLPKRWIIEPTFGWLGRYWRLGRDYEDHPRRSEAMLRVAVIDVMQHRPARG